MKTCRQAGRQLTFLKVTVHPSVCGGISAGLTAAVSSLNPHQGILLTLILPNVCFIVARLQLYNESETCSSEQMSPKTEWVQDDTWVPTWLPWIWISRVWYRQADEGWT